jgi:hypothetical protein
VGLPAGESCIFSDRRKGHTYSIFRATRHFTAWLGKWEYIIVGCSYHSDSIVPCLPLDLRKGCPAHNLTSPTVNNNHRHQHKATTGANLSRPHYSTNPFPTYKDIVSVLRHTINQYRKALLTITNEHQPSPTITNHHQPSPTITNHHQPSPTITNEHQSLENPLERPYQRVIPLRSCE